MINTLNNIDNAINIGNFDIEYGEYCDSLIIAEKTGEKPKKQFVIDSIEKAEWALKKIKHYEAQTAMFKAYLEKELDKLNTWFEREKSKNDYDIGHLKYLLKPYAAQQLKDGNKKTLSLPSGKMSFRKQSPKFEKNEEELFVFVKKTYPDFIVTKESVEWGAFKNTLKIEDGRAVTSDGEILDCVTVIPQEDSFYVKVVD